MKNTKLGSRGFTLLELAFVIGIIITLVAILVPLAMDKLAQSKVTKAQADLDAISAALTNFFTDIGSFPSCNAADCDPNDDAANNLKFLAVCAGAGGDATASCAGEYPGSATWGDLTTQDEATLAKNNLYNHLVINNPDANGAVGAAGVDYKTTKWKGPYITKLGADPWGSAYIIHIGSMQKNGCPVDTGGAVTCGSATTAKGWIVSAGPDGTLQTAPMDSKLSGDDIGYIFCTNC